MSPIAVEDVQLSVTIQCRCCGAVRNHNTGENLPPRCTVCGKNTYFNSETKENEPLWHCKQTNQDYEAGE